MLIMLTMLMMRLLFKKILYPKNAGAAIGSPARGGRRGNRIFRISLLYFCNLNCIAVYFSLSYFYNLHCCRGNRVFFKLHCGLHFMWRANQTPLSQSNHFPGFVFHFCIQALQHHLGNELWFLDKASTFELVCKWKWSNEIKVWKIDMSNFSHATLLDLSQYPTDIRRIPLQLNMKLWAVSEWQKNFPFYKCSN